MFEKYNKVQRAVLETTLRIIIEKELQATSMALIAKESGVSTGSIYHYFSSKEEIINELYRAIVLYNGEYVTRGMDAKEPIRTRFNRAWEKVFQVSLTHPEGFQFIEQYSFSPYINDAVKRESYDGGWCKSMAALYAKAIDYELFIEQEPAMMVQMHYGTMAYLVKGHLQNHFTLTDDVIQTVINSCWKSVAK
ncbi:TetR/AcrR family transcriptional regulator [Paenibacillus sp. XY044]|uniref:TetR/AcrR family transcriptional regulator n=1 Tax=Paenibacillus sp. XY044 TaxID=2026089 RepID=UPI000B995057|nr:TetR/AcrR family transcriptional regulator [Paenibacillus sp. XY044]OZB93050.1 TetR family transcriptional regulator [Paenibacillus sp. XY044]